MDLTPAVQCTTRQEWRDWLTKHHASQPEAWLVYFKKHTGKPSVNYRESVEEALCFGWIDGLKRRIDDERYAHRFTPRKPKSRWSPLNIRLAEEQIAAGRMSDAGLRAFNNRLTYDEAIPGDREAGDQVPPSELEAVLETRPQARKNFDAMAPGYRRQYAAWVGSAKREDTRRRRAAKAAELLEQNKKPGMV